MLLADIGNSRVHIFDGNKVSHISINEMIELYNDTPVNYISVNSSFVAPKNYPWSDISSLLTLQGAYDTMGVDRKALCFSHDNGIFIDAGSAITVDIVRDGVYRGGFILLGIRAYAEAYGEISKALKIDFNPKCSLESMPFTTKDSISYGIISSIKSAIDSHSSDLPLYFTGGDGEWLSGFFPNSIFDELLVFRGLQKVLKGNI